jgi:hypothetical protein
MNRPQASFTSGIEDSPWAGLISNWKATAFILQLREVLEEQPLLYTLQPTPSKRGDASSGLPLKCQIQAGFRNFLATSRWWKVHGFMQ